MEEEDVLNNEAINAALSLQDSAKKAIFTVLGEIKSDRIVCLVGSSSGPKTDENFMRYPLGGKVLSLRWTILTI